MRVIRMTESIVPKQITTPIGIQRRSPLIIIGSTPRAVVQEVRKIGRIRRFPAREAASLTGMPCSKRSSSAYSNSRIPLRTMMPTREMSPRTAVIEKSRPKIQRPKKAPKRHRVLRTRVRTAREIFLKWKSRKKNRIITAAMNERAISGPIWLFTPLSPPNFTMTPSGMSAVLRYRFMALTAVGWLFPNFMSAPTIMADLPSMRVREVGSHSGVTVAT